MKLSFSHFKNETMDLQADLTDLGLQYEVWLWSEQVKNYWGMN